jgi:hypothetical protein
MLGEAAGQCEQSRIYREKSRTGATPLGRDELLEESVALFREFPMTHETQPLAQFFDARCLGTYVGRERC